MELLGKLGLDWKLLLAQVINFLILFFLLRKFLYKPILSIIEKRQKKIKHGLANAEKAEKDLVHASARAEKIINKANKMSHNIIKKSENQAEDIKNKIISETEIRIKDMQSQAQEEIAQAKEQMMADAKDELFDLIIMASEKVLMEKIDGDKDKILVEKALSGMSKIYKE